MVNDTILLVDDDYVVNFLNQKAIEKLELNLHIVTASNGRDALEKLATMVQAGNPLPRMILLDLNMPIMNGFGFLEAFKHVPFYSKDVTIAVVSSSGDAADIERARELGATHFIQKPLDHEKLASVIKPNA